MGGRRRALSKKKQIKEKKNKDDEIPSPTPYLPDDVLTLILRRLPLEAQIRLRSSCRSWLSLGLGTVKPRLQFPWLLIYKADLSSYFLYNPSTRKSHLFRHSFPNTCPLHRSEPESGSDNRTYVLAASSGWLLMSLSCCSRALFLYNPFTRSTLQIPPHPETQLFRYRTSYAFNFCHVERVFTVYAALVNEPNRTVLSSWHSGERDWKIIDTILTALQWPDFNFTCDARVLYLLTEMKVMAYLRTGDGGFDCVDVELPQELRVGNIFSSSSLCVSEGDLYIVSTKGLSCLRLDLAERTWVLEEGKEKAYFHSNWRISAVVISEPSEEFAGYVVSGIEGGRGYKKCAFGKVPISSMRAERDGCLWSFSWPRNVLSHFDPRLTYLNMLWIETPTL